MPPKSQQPGSAAPHGFDADLAGVHATGDLTPDAAEPLLRRFLTHRNNLIVARAAKAVKLHNLVHLADDLATAFARFLPAVGDPAKTDSQCWAKHELARTLAAFEYQSPEVFLAGLRYIQLEPVWGGSSDSAGPLRGTCALALVQCRDLPSSDLLRHLTPLFCDKELPVRVNAARAVEQAGSDSAALLLRLRAELASDESELLGACIGGVLRLEGPSALPWAAAFLRAEDDLAAEAAYLLAAHRSTEAVVCLTHAFRAACNRDFRENLLTALAASRLPEAYRFLLSLAAEGGMFASVAKKSIQDSEPPGEIAAELNRL